MDPISDFLERCDKVAELRGIQRSTLSTLLFKDGKRLGQLAKGNSDVGVKRLEIAKRDLAALEPADQCAA
jgi:hypothetical protein